MSDSDFREPPANQDDRTADPVAFHQHPSEPKTYRLPQPQSSRRLGSYWLIIGIFMLLYIVGIDILLPVQLALMLPPHMPQPIPMPNRPIPVLFPGSCFMDALLCALMTIAGIRQVRGRARDTLSVSLICSIAALFYIGIGSALGYAASLERRPPETLIFLSAANAVTGVVFFSAAVFGFLARKEHLEWYNLKRLAHEAQGQTTKRPRAAYGGGFR